LFRWNFFYGDTVGPPWPNTQFIHRFTSSFILTSRCDHLKRRPKSSDATPATQTARPEDLLHRIESASTTAQAEAAGKAFRDWAEAEGLLLVPPEDHQGSA
jgi:hypothetical protein